MNALTPSQPTRLNLLIDEKLAIVLNFFRAKYPLLKDVDIIRMAISQSYVAEIEKLPTHKLNNEEEESLELALEDLHSNKAKYKPYSNVNKMVDDMLADKI
jgi:hypothetical protein